MIIFASGFTVGFEPSPFPTVIVSTASLSVSGAFDVTIDISKDTSDFVIGDITVTNGTKSNFISVSAKQYTCTITPTVSGNVTVKVNAASFTSGGYQNKVSNTVTVAYSAGGVDARIFIIAGQSNVVPGGITLASMPGYLLDEIDVSLWHNTNNIFSNIHCGVNVSPWPVVKLAYDLRQLYSEEIYIVQYGISGSYLATQWGQGAIYYNNLLGYYNNALLELSDRNFLQKSFIWIQGEADSKTPSDANAYQANLTNLVSAVRADFDVTKFVDCDIYASLPPVTFAYSATVRTAKQTVDSADANFYLGDATSWGHQADNIHLDANGIISCGEYAASVL